MALKKTYLYKVSRNGQFLGVLQNVTDPFGYTHNINSPSASMTIIVGQTIDTSHEAPEAIQTESSQDIQTEDSQTITTERTPDVIGAGNANSLMQNNNDIEVYEFSDDYPNGKLVFAGYISRVKANIGGTGEVTLTVLSNGTDLDNHLVSGNPYATDVSQSTQNASFNSWYDNDFEGRFAAQTFIAGLTNLGKLDLYLQGNGDPVTVTIKVYNGAPTNDNATSIGSTSQVISSTTAGVYSFVFSTPITLTVGNTYSFTVTLSQGVTSSNPFKVYYKNSNVYASGAMYNNAFFGPSFNHTYNITPTAQVGTASDLYFVTYSNSGSTTAIFTSEDPATILTEIIDAYVAEGGLIDYDGTSITLTGNLESYTFKVNTVLEGIKKCLELAPSNYYFYVNPATGIITFKPVNATADHKIIFGRHINELDLEFTVEQVKNIVYFSGGETAGVNLFIKVSDEDSLEINRAGLIKISDNRVTLSDTATTLSQNFLDENSSEQYQTQVTILSTTYDLTLFNPGETVGFEGFGTFVDNLILQIVGITRTPDSTTLALGMLPHRSSAKVEDINRALRAQETINNPDVPS